MKQWLLAPLAGAIALAASSVASQSSRQEIPLNPTFDQCVSIQGGDYLLVESISRQISACHANSPGLPTGVVSLPINMLPDTAAECASTKQESTAWPQCSARYEPALCQARGQQKARFKTCTDRARRVRSEQERDSQEEKTRLDLLKKYDDTWDRAEEIKDAMSDPMQLTRYLSVKDHALGDDLKKNPDVAVELTRFTERYTVFSLQAAMQNPIIRKIQGDSFDRLFDHIREMHIDLETLNGAMVTFSRDLALAGERSPNASSVRSLGQVHDRCSILANPDASRNLMSQDPSEWAALNSSCPR